MSADGTAWLLALLVGGAGLYEMYKSPPLRNPIIIILCVVAVLVGAVGIYGAV